MSPLRDTRHVTQVQAFFLFLVVLLTSNQTFNNAITTFYNSTEFMQTQTDHAAFFNTVGQYLDGRPVTLQNMVRLPRLIHVIRVY